MARRPSRDVSQDEIHAATVAAATTIGATYSSPRRGRRRRDHLRASASPSPDPKRVEPHRGGGAPVLYDTSVSSGSATTLSDHSRPLSAGRNFRSSVVAHHYGVSLSSSHSSSATMYHPPQVFHEDVRGPRTTTVTPATTAAQPRYAQSEPGSVYHDRFAAYLHRFTGMEPTEQTSQTPPRRLDSARPKVWDEEKKDESDLSRSPSSLTDRVRRRTLALRKSQRESQLEPSSLEQTEYDSLRPTSSPRHSEPHRHERPDEHRPESHNPPRDTESAPPRQSQREAPLQPYSLEQQSSLEQQQHSASDSLRPTLASPRHSEPSRHERPGDHRPESHNPPRDMAYESVPPRQSQREAPLQPYSLEQQQHSAYDSLRTTLEPRHSEPSRHERTGEHRPESHNPPRDMAYESVPPRQSQREAPLQPFSLEQQQHSAYDSLRPTLASPRHSHHPFRHERSDGAEIPDNDSPRDMAYESAPPRASEAYQPVRRTGHDAPHVSHDPVHTSSPMSRDDPELPVSRDYHPPEPLVLRRPREYHTRPEPYTVSFGHDHWHPHASSTPSPRAATRPSLETASDIGVSSTASNRTRDLARRLEQRMAHRHGTGPTATQSFMVHETGPTQYATTIVQDGHANRVEERRLNEPLTPRQHSSTLYQSQDGPMTTRGNNVRTVQLDHTLMEHDTRHQTRALPNGHTIPTPLYRSDERDPQSLRSVSPLYSQRHTSEQGPKRERYNGSNNMAPTGADVDATRRRNADRTEPLERERSTSLPPVRRNMSSLAPSDNGNHVPSSVAERVAAHQLLYSEPPRRSEPNIRRVGRAEIETPSPANVSELRRLLWTEDEHLNVSIRSSFREFDEMPAETTRVMDSRTRPHSVEHRNTRSVSPNIARRSVPPDDGVHSSSAAREQKGLLFKSRYYEAARRELGSVSPVRPTRETKADKNVVSHTQKSFESSHNTSGTSSAHHARPQTTPTPSPSSKNTRTEDTTRSTTPASHKSTSAATTPASQKSAPVIAAVAVKTKDDVELIKRSSQETMESLLLKLGQVNRDDPGAALAQIDAILKQGTIDSSGEQVYPSQTYPSQTTDAVLVESDDVKSAENAATGIVNEGDAELDDDDESTSDETSVSSMTNPTYQEAKSKAQGTPSAVGRPRPSNLGAYTNTGQSPTLTHTPGGERSTKNEKKVTKVPPTSIRVSNRKDMESSVSELVTDFQTKTQERMRDLESRTSTPPVGAEAKSGELTFLQKLGTLISPTPSEPHQVSSSVDEKIKRWDDMSTGALPHVDSQGTRSTRKGGSHPDDVESTGTKTDLGSLVTEERDVSPAALRRAHPWDSSIPVRMGHVKVHDTSMECGAGVEAMYTPKYAIDALSPDRSNILPVRRMRKDRLAREALNSRAVISETHPVVAGDDFEVNPKMPLNKNDPRHEQSQVMSDAFDSAWVNLPSSNYFNGGRSLSRGSAAERRRSRSRDGKHQSDMSKARAATVLPQDDNAPRLVTSFSDDRKLPSADESYSKGTKQNSTRYYAPLESDDRGSQPQHQQSTQGSRSYGNAARTNEDRGNTNVNAETARVDKSGKSQSRGLRGFLKRKQAAAIVGKFGTNVDQATLVSASSTWRSNASSRDVHHATSVIVEPTSSSSFADRNRNRRQQSGVSPDRSRARSLDERRIRTPSLARKYSRLLRVYDQDIANTDNT